MKIKLTHIKWPLVLIAVLMWGGTGLFAWVITSDEVDRALRVQNAQETETKEASATRIHAIAQDTVRERGQLDAMLHVDVVSVVDMIEASGKAAGVKLVVSNVQPESVLPARGAAAPKMTTTGFVVDARGTFSSLMHLTRLLEKLPVPAKIGRLDIERTGATGQGASSVWHMSVYLRVLTASEISS